MSTAFLLNAVVLVLALGVALLAPLFVKAKGRASPADDLAAKELSRRLATIDSERAAGLLDDEGAAEATLEAQHAVLAMSKSTSDHKETDTKTTGLVRAWRFAAVICVGLAPIVTAFIYLSVGAPTYQQAAPPPPNTAASPAEAIAAMEPDARAAAIENMVDGLAARLAEALEDVAGWRMLARSQSVLGRHEDAAESYRQLLALTSGALEDWRNFATARAAAQPSGQFPNDEEFLSILAEIEARAPADPAALFFRGGALNASGDPAGAATTWRKLKGTLPEDAPILGVLEGLIASADAEAASDEGAAAP